jgi:hypothetical protein
VLASPVAQRAPSGQSGRVSVAVLLWDFGDTLVDERWMRRAPAEFPDWPNAWNKVIGNLRG